MFWHRFIAIPRKRIEMRVDNGHSVDKMGVDKKKRTAVIKQKENQ